MIMLGLLFKSPKLFFSFVAVVIVALLIFGFVKYGEVRQKTIQVLEKQEQYIDTRQRIDENVKSVRDIDADAALEWLRQRQNNK